MNWVQVCTLIMLGVTGVGRLVLAAMKADRGDPYAGDLILGVFLLIGVTVVVMAETQKGGG